MYYTVLYALWYNQYCQYCSCSPNQQMQTPSHIHLHEVWSICPWVFAILRGSRRSRKARPYCSSLQLTWRLSHTSLMTHTHTVSMIPRSSLPSHIPAYITFSGHIPNSHKHMPRAFGNAQEFFLMSLGLHFSFHQRYNSIRNTFLVRTRDVPDWRCFSVASIAVL